MNPKLAFSQNNSTTFHHTRYPPSYEAANVSYSLRLPTYRSSYIRRFHPYARYARIEEFSDDDEDEDNWVEDMLFDLGILEEQVPLPPAAIAGADRNIDNNVEEPQQGGALLVIDPAVVDAGDEEQRGEAENLARFPVFHRLDVNLIRGG